MSESIDALCYPLFSVHIMMLYLPTLPIAMDITPNKKKELLSHPILPATKGMQNLTQMSTPANSDIKNATSDLLMP